MVLGGALGQLPAPSEPLDMAGHRNPCRYTGPGALDWDGLPLLRDVACP